MPCADNRRRFPICIGGLKCELAYSHPSVFLVRPARLFKFAHQQHHYQSGRIVAVVLANLIGLQSGRPRSEEETELKFEYNEARERN